MSKLGNYISVQNGYAFKSKDFIKNLSGMPVIKIGNVTGGSFIDLSSYDTISEEIARKVKSFQTKDDDILIAMTGANVGKVSRIAKGTQPCLINQRVGRFILKEDCPYSSDFIYYLVSSNKSFQYFSNTADGAAQPNISGKLIEDLEFPDISPKSANKAGKYLKVLDEKIQLNTQINQTLEQSAQALFKSWFVDFDPVRAKAQALSDALSLEQAELATMQTISGKTAEELTALLQTQPDRYAELAEIAKAFPCEMVEINGVEVPKGWEYQYLKDICNIVYGKNLPTTKLIKEGYPVFGGNGVIGYYDKFLYETPQTLVSCRGAASGKVLYSLPYSFVTNNSLVIEHEKSGLSYFYIYEALRLQNLTELTSGSAQPQMTIANMAVVQILVPSEKINEVCKKYLGTLYNQIYQNNIENETLAQTRDLLLPKFLSGDFND